MLLDAYRFRIKTFLIEIGIIITIKCHSLSTVML